MHGPYPGELRLRVIDFVEGGGSRRGAAEHVEVSVSSAIGGCNGFVKTELANRCLAVEALRLWRSIHGRFSHSSAPNLTLRWMKLFRLFTSGESREAAVHCPAFSLAMA